MKDEHFQDSTEITTEFLKNKIDQNGSKFQPPAIFSDTPIYHSVGAFHFKNMIKIDQKCQWQV